jgi:ABC-type transport system involved in multi-copper enzyme maturation permease subunit
MNAVVRMEWIKLRSVRSTWWTLAVFVAGMVALGAVTVATTTPHDWAQWTHATQASWDPTNSGFSGLFIAQFCAGVLAVMAVTSEYSSGMIRATLAAVPRRRAVLAGKAAAVGALVLAVGEVLAFLTFFGVQLALKSPVPHATLGQPGVLRAVLMAGAYPFLVAMMAVGLALIFRHTAGAICAVVGLLFILPLLTAVLPHTLHLDIDRFLPLLIAENSITAVKFMPGLETLNPWAGFAVLCGYAVALLALGGWLLARRDA